MRTSTRRLLFLGAIIGVLCVAVYVLVLRLDDDLKLSDHEPGARAEDSAESGRNEQPRESAVVGAVQDLHWIDIDASIEQLEAALATSDIRKWGPALSELKNPNYRREEAIAVLAAVLAHPSWEVRVSAARHLLELGSQEGVVVLQSALAALARGEDVPEEIVVSAAAALHKFRQPVDGSAVFKAYELFERPELLNIAAAQHALELVPLVLERKIGSWIGTGAMLGINASEFVDELRNLLTDSSPQRRVVIHWALYRSSADENSLKYIIETVEERVGLKEKTEKSDAFGSANSNAASFLQMAVTPVATASLREITDYVARSPDGNSVHFGQAFAALFYLHQDYGFVDDRVLSFLNGHYSGLGIDQRLMWYVAAARRTSEIEAAAKAKDPASYEYYFLRLEERPVESWAAGYFRYLPIDVLPPLEEDQRE